MSIRIIVDKPEKWSLHIPDIEVVSAKDYLTDPKYVELRGLKIYNLCESYRYQSFGYYVSLLATARRHKVTPSISTLRSMTLGSVKRIFSEEIEDLIQSSLHGIQSDTFTFSIYFGRNLAKKYDRLALSLFNAFQAPFVRAFFERNHREKKWELKQISPIAASDIPKSHHEFVIEQATRYFKKSKHLSRKTVSYRYDIAILYEPDEENPPSGMKSLQKFIDAAEELGMRAELITKDDYAKLGEYDALFIRRTTNVNHYTYNFARRAEAEGMPVIDDPESIVRCSNKVFLSELLTRIKVPQPKTYILNRNEAVKAPSDAKYPLIIKLPDGAFSRGVVKVSNEEEYASTVTSFFKKSALLVAQEYLPTTFDWRIGILNGQVLFACKYFMAQHHWQIVRKTTTGSHRFGKTETLPLDQVPTKALKVALQTAKAIGNGLYGVDIKQSGDKFYVIEINDNPNLDAGFEDKVIKDELYLTVMRTFLERIRANREKGSE